MRNITDWPIGNDSEIGSGHFCAGLRGAVEDIGENGDGSRDRALQFRSDLSMLHPRHQAGSGTGEWLVTRKPIKAGVPWGIDVYESRWAWVEPVVGVAGCVPGVDYSKLFDGTARSVLCLSAPGFHTGSLSALFLPGTRRPVGEHDYAEYDQGA